MADLKEPTDLGADRTRVVHVPRMTPDFGGVVTFAATKRWVRSPDGFGLEESDAPEGPWTPVPDIKVC